MASSRSGKGKDEVGLVLSVDGDGVVRVESCEADQFLVTPDQLAKILTGIIAAIVGVQDEGETIKVSMN